MITSFLLFTMLGLQQNQTKTAPQKTQTAAQKTTQPNAPQPSEPAKDLIPILYEVESAYGKNALRAEGVYLNKPLTFRTYVSQVIPKGSTIILKTGILYHDGQGPLILSDIIVKPTMKAIVTELEPDDIVEITATMTSRTAKSKDEVAIGGNISSVSGSNGFVSGGGGVIRGGTVTRTWTEYAFSGGSVKVVSRKADRDKEAARVAQEQARLKQDALAAQQEVYRKAVKEFDLDSLKKVVEWEGVGHHTITALAKLCIEADPKAPNYKKVCEAFRFLVAQCDKDSNLAGGRTAIYSIARPAVEARRPALLKELLDSETFNPKRTLDSMPAFTAMTTYRRNAMRKEGDSVINLPDVALDALDVEMFKMVYEHPRCEGLADDKGSLGIGLSFRQSLWGGFGWVKNDYLTELRKIIPKPKNNN